MIECPTCKSTFKARRKTSKYCSQQCQWDSLHKERPKAICRNCNGEFFIANGGTGNFCSRSCSVTLNNKLFPKREKIFKADLCVCMLNGDKEFQLCPVHPKISAKSASAWLNGFWRGGTNHGLSRTVRSYLLDKAEYKCSKCGFNTPHPDDNSSVLEINHVNGNGLDHSKDNLEVLCPNCHSLTSSYRGRNQDY